MSKDRTIAVLIALACLASISLDCIAQTISPSTQTRTLAPPKDDYLQEITSGHPIRWFDRDMKLKVLIKPGAGVPHYQAQFEDLLRKAFSVWEVCSDNKIHFQYVTEGPADITCEFVENIPKQPPSVAGLTSYQTSPHHMESAAIALKTTCSIRPMTDDTFHCICLHEIGHALGLVKHSPDPHDVMYPNLCMQRHLSDRDIKTINMLYNFKPPDSILRMSRRPQKDPKYPFGTIVLSSAEYDAYTRQVVTQVRKSFSRYSTGPMWDCSIRCFVDSTGNIFNYRIWAPSGNTEFDEKALDALIAAVPLPAVPDQLLKNKWLKAPIALKFRSDGWVIPYIEPDLGQSVWLEDNEQPSPEEMMKDLEKYQAATKKIIDPALEPWIVSITQKALSCWKYPGTGRAEVILGLKKDGQIGHLVIMQPSTDPAFDYSVRKACLAGEPYPPPPNSTSDITEINLLFER